jgi:hypothetical protein
MVTTILHQSCITSSFWFAENSTNQKEETKKLISDWLFQNFVREYKNSLKNWTFLQNLENLVILGISQIEILIFQGSLDFNEFVEKNLKQPIRKQYVS